MREEKVIIKLIMIHIFIPHHDVSVEARLAVVSSPTHPFAVQYEVLGNPEDWVRQALLLTLTKFPAEQSS